jgi:hypothetical protein
MGPNARRKRTIRAPLGSPDTEDLYREPSAPQIRRAAEILSNDPALDVRRGRVKENVPVAERVNTVDFYGIDLPWPDR